MTWFILFLAGAFEIAWAVGMKLSDGFTKPLVSILTVVGMIISFIFLGIALKNLPLGTAYAVWTGIGTIGAAIAGIFLFSEPVSAFRLICIALIVTGIAGLKLASA